MTIATRKGSCHCGAVAFEVDIGLDSLIECNCSHCYRKGFVLGFASRDAFRLISGEEMLTGYRFHEHKIDHRFCQACGVQPFGFGRMPDGTETVAVNVRVLEDVEPWAWSAQRVDGRSF